MVSNFEIGIKNLTDAQRLVKNSIDFEVHIPSIISDINKFEAQFREHIEATYTVKQSLFSVKDVSKRKSFFNYSLTYKTKPIDLSKYAYSTYIGNINTGATRTGMVHKTKLKRAGDYKTLYGYKHFGGFIQRSSKTRMMFERSQKETWLDKNTRAPIHVLWGPTLVNLAETELSSPKVGKLLNKLENSIANRFLV